MEDAPEKFNVIISALCGLHAVPSPFHVGSTGAIITVFLTVRCSKVEIVMLNRSKFPTGVGRTMIIAISVPLCKTQPLSMVDCSPGSADKLIIIVHFI